MPVSSVRKCEGYMSQGKLGAKQWFAVLLNSGSSDPKQLITNAVPVGEPSAADTPVLLFHPPISAFTIHTLSVFFLKKPFDYTEVFLPPTYFAQI